MPEAPLDDHLSSLVEPSSLLTTEPCPVLRDIAVSGHTTLEYKYVQLYTVQLYSCTAGTLGNARQFALEHEKSNRWPKHRYGTAVGEHCTGFADHWISRLHAWMPQTSHKQQTIPEHTNCY